MIVTKAKTKTKGKPLGPIAKKMKETLDGFADKREKKTHFIHMLYKVIRQ